jgi:hypothetical protein
MPDRRWNGDEDEMKCQTIVDSPDVPYRTVTRSFWIRVVLADHLLRSRRVVVFARQRVDERLSFRPVQYWLARKGLQSFCNQHERSFSFSLSAFYCALGGTRRLTLHDPPVQMIDPDDPVTPTRIDVLSSGTLDRAKVTPYQGREDVVPAVGHYRAVERVGLVPRFTVVSAPATGRGVNVSSQNSVER